MGLQPTVVMQLMDVQVANSPIGTARVLIDLGGGHQLEVEATYDTDRYTSVDVRWVVPAHVIDQPRDRKVERLLGARLDQQEGNAVLAPIREA